MTSSRIGLKGGVLAVLLCTALVVGCGDDDPSSEGGAGSSSDGGKAGSSGSGGKAGSGSSGSDSGGKAGSGTAGTTNEAGMGNPDPMGGAGGGDTDPPVGGDDAGGAGGAGSEPTFAEITKLDDNVYDGANDLRGLRFGASGKLWASGHIGINANPSVAGEPDKQLVIARFTADGIPDSSFSDDGFLQVNLVERVEDDTDPQAIKVVNDGNEESLGIVELTGGDIVVSANVRDANGKGMDAVVARFTAAGAPVTGFGDNGVARVVFGWAPADDASWTATSPAAPSDNSWGLELDKSGAEEKLVVFGAGTALKGSTTGNPATQRTDNDRYVTRLLVATGAIDPAFNAGKAFTYNTGGTNGDNGRRGLVEADGSIIAGGYTNFTPGGNHVIAIRLKPEGTRDTAFGHIANDRGIIRSNPLIDDGGASECYAVVRQSSGRLITGGYGAATASGTSSRFGYVTTAGPDLVALGFKPDGSALDQAWGNVGMFVAQSEELSEARAEERARDMLALADDRLVYAGNFATDPAIYVTTPNGDFDPANEIGALFRYTPLTTTTGANGNVSTSHFFRVVQSADRKRIAATTSQNVDGVLLAVLKVGE